MFYTSSAVFRRIVDEIQFSSPSNRRCNIYLAPLTAEFLLLRGRHPEQIDPVPHRRVCGGPHRLVVPAKTTVRCNYGDCMGLVVLRTSI